jgi:hypothetical protein
MGSVEFYYYLHNKIVFAFFYSVAFHAGLRRNQENSVIRKKIFNPKAANLAFFDCTIRPNQCYAKSCVRIDCSFDKLQKTHKKYLVLMINEVCFLTKNSGKGGLLLLFDFSFCFFLQFGNNLVMDVLRYFRSL